MPRKPRAKPFERKGELPARDESENEAEREVPREAEPAAERGRDVERDEPIRRSGERLDHQD